MRSQFTIGFCLGTITAGDKRNTGEQQHSQQAAYKLFSSHNTIQIKSLIDGETEKTFPFTEEKWPLLDSETMKEERITQEEGGIYVSKLTLNEPKHKIFEAGYEESEVDLRVEFELQT